MPSINDACEALAAVIGTHVDGLRASGYIDDTVNAPQAQVFTREFDPRMVFGNSKRPFQLGVRVFVKRTNPRSAQAALRSYMEPSGPESILEAIESEEYWDETIDYAEVTNIGQPFELELLADVYWCVDFDVDVIW